MNPTISESIAKNTTVMIVAQMGTWVTSFVLLLFLPRYLGSEDYGLLFLAISIALIVSVIIDFGGSYIIPKEVSRSKTKTAQLLISFMGVRFFIWILCMAGMLLFCYLVNYTTTATVLIVILGFSKLLEGLSRAIRSCFQGYELMEYPSLGVVAEQVSVAALAVLALLHGSGPVLIAVIMAFGSLVNLIVCYTLLPRIVNKLPVFKFRTSYGLLKGSLPYFMWSVFAVIYYRIDAVMLSIMTGDAVVGWYGGAYRLFDIVMFLPAIFATVVFPIFSKLWGNQANDLSNTFHQSLKFILMAAIPMSVLFFSFSENLIALFYGLDEYEPSVLILQIFSLGIVLVYVDFVLGSAILAADKQRSWALIGFVAVLVNIGSNFIMIPYTQLHFGNGAIGAAVTTLFTELIIMISAISMLWKGLFLRYDFSLPLKCFLCGGIMVGVIGGINLLGYHWLMQATAGLGGYFLLILLLVVSRDEMVFMQQFYSRDKIKSIFSLTK